MNTIGQRLKAERVAANLSQEDLGREAKVSKQAISKIENDLVQNPEARTIEPICRRLNLNSHWLLTGRGPKRPADNGEDAADWANIMGFVSHVALGAGAVAEDYAETHKLKFRTQSLRRKGLYGRQLEVYYGRGDSMTPRIRDGDALLVDRSDTTPKDDAIFVLESEDGAVAKRLVEIDGRWFVCSDNKDDPAWRKPIPMDGRKHFKIVGRVRWIGSWEG